MWRSPRINILLCWLRLAKLVKQARIASLFYQSEYIRTTGVLCCVESDSCLILFILVARSYNRNVHTVPSFTGYSLTGLYIKHTQSGDSVMEKITARHLLSASTGFAS